MKRELSLLIAALIVAGCSESESGSGAGGAGTSSGGAGGKSSGGASGGGGAAASGGSGASDSGAGGVSGSSGGASGSGGAPTTGGSGGSGASGSGGDAGAPPASGCKRGIAANIAPGVEFFPAVSWWYNWAIASSGADVGIEFVPMIWNGATAGDELPGDAAFLLGFNEPNFFAQADLSAQEAASLWPQVEASAAARGVPIVSPAMNYCGPADQCHDTDPYAYLKDFFAACQDCRVDYVAVHWYNCDLPSLRDYLEPGGNLEGFEQFGRPLWLTEFSCDPSASVADQEAYMREAIPYLENKPEVFRYSWFSAGPIPNAELIEDDGSPTALGRVYIELDQSCR